MIIMLSSELPGQGKDTVADYICQKYGFEKLAFADELKNICYQIGWNGEKDEKGRRLLIDIGNSARKYDKDVWVKKIISKILKDKDKNYVISDCRFANEYKNIKSLFKEVYLIGITSTIRGDRRLLGDESQKEYYEIKKDFVIMNNYKTKEGLYDGIDKIMEEVGFSE